MIRELKESIEEKVALESYAIYIETPGEGSVCVRLLVPWKVHSFTYTPTVMLIIKDKTTGPNFSISYTIILTSE